MISCQKCGGLNQEGSNFCEFCGSNLINNQSYNSVTSTYNNQIENINQNTNVQNSNQNNGFNNMIDDNELIDAYIGKNAEEIKNMKFSAPSLIFGIPYLLYRRMFIASFIWFLVLAFILRGVLAFLLELNSNLLIIFIPIIICNILIAFFFKKMYLSYAKKKVLQIKNQNSSCNSQELVKICSMKGGTGTGVAIAMTVIVLFPILFFLFVYFGLGYIMNNSLDARKQEMVDQAKTIVSAVKNDVISYGFNSPKTNPICNNNTCLYNQQKINILLNNKVQVSSFGGYYRNASYSNPTVDGEVYVKVIRNNNTYNYQICMIDENNNGFDFTYENMLAKDIVKNSMLNNCSK